MSRKFGFALTVALVAVSAASNAVTIVQWNFNDKTLTPQIGTGTISLIGGVEVSISGTDGGFPSGSGSSDPGSGNVAYSTKTYPAQNTGSGTAGIQFAISSVGYKDLVFTFDTKHSNTASKYIRVDYSLDGTNFVDGPTYSTTTSFTNGLSLDLTSIDGANNNANLAVRIVAVFEPGTNAYLATTTPTYSYGPGGTMRYDMITLSGTAAPVPEPASLIALGVGAVGLLSRRRRK